MELKGDFTLVFKIQKDTKKLKVINIFNFKSIIILIMDLIIENN